MSEHVTTSTRPRVYFHGCAYVCTSPKQCVCACEYAPGPSGPRDSIDVFPVIDWSSSRDSEHKSFICSC